MKKCFFYYFATLFLMFSNTSYAIVLNQKDSSLKTITPLSISHKKPSFFQKIVLKIAEKRLKKLSKRSNNDEVSSQGDKAVLITVLASSGLAISFYIVFLLSRLVPFWFYSTLGILFLGGVICGFLSKRKDVSRRRRTLAIIFAVLTIFSTSLLGGLIAWISTWNFSIF